VTVKEKRVGQKGEKTNCRK